MNQARDSIAQEEAVKQREVIMTQLIFARRKAKGALAEIVEVVRTLDNLLGK